LEVLDLGTFENGDRYMVMEYLDGETLAERIERQQRLAPRQIAPIARQLLAALASAHAIGIIHRDLKPDNIFVLRSKAGRTDFVKLIDFGISKFSDIQGVDRTTRAGSLLGTPCYMSPEQARGKGEADVRSDIYSCGVILFEAVTGRLPFEAETFNDLMFQIALSDAPSPLSIVPSLDPEFVWLIQRAMAREPEKRFQTVQEFSQALDGWMVKNELTDTLAQPLPENAFPPRPQVRISRPDATETTPLDSDVDMLAFQKTSSHDEAWSQTDGVPGVRKRRTMMMVGGGVAALVVGLVVVLAVRSSRGPDPATRHGTVVAASAPIASVDTPPAGSTAHPDEPSATPSASATEATAPATPTSSAASSGPVRFATKTKAVASAAPKASATKPNGSPKKLDFGY
jgi:serine/threonine-protein kinase